MPPTALAMREPAGFQLLQHGHRDMVEAAEFNSYGTRFALGSADGRIKVYDKMRDGTWRLGDTWNAHTAEVHEVHWLPSTIHPNLLCSIGMDSKFKIWTEDPSAPVGSGRRFCTRNSAPIYEQRSSQRSPFMSFSVRHNPETRTSHVVLLERSSLVTCLENDEPENMYLWTPIDSFTAGTPPAIGEESSFRIKFDPNLEPVYGAVGAGMPRDTLSIIVVTHSTVRIWRTKLVSHDVTLGAATTREFYPAVDILTNRTLIRDVAWAPGSIRGFDIVATVGKDGAVRVFEIHVPAAASRARSSGLSSAHRANNDSARGAPASSHDLGAAHCHGGPSGIGAGLAGTKGGGASSGSATETPSATPQPSPPPPATTTITFTPGTTSRTPHPPDSLAPPTLRAISRLESHAGPVWRCQFDEDGLVLGTCGDDGRVLLWRRRPDGKWAESGELAMRQRVLGAGMGIGGLGGGVSPELGGGLVMRAGEVLGGVAGGGGGSTGVGGGSIERSVESGTGTGTAAATAAASG